LADKYIRTGDINKQRVKKHYPDAEIECVADVLRVVGREKMVVGEREYKNRILHALCDKRMLRKFRVLKKVKYSRREKLLKNQGVSYWLV